MEAEKPFFVASVALVVHDTGGEGSGLEAIEELFETDAQVRLRLQKRIALGLFNDEGMFELVLILNVCIGRCSQARRRGLLHGGNPALRHAARVMQQSSSGTTSNELDVEYAVLIDDTPEAYTEDEILQALAEEGADALAEELRTRVVEPEVQAAVVDEVVTVVAEEPTLDVATIDYGGSMQAIADGAAASSTEVYVPPMAQEVETGGGDVDGGAASAGSSSIDALVQQGGPAIGAIAVVGIAVAYMQRRRRRNRAASQPVWVQPNDGAAPAEGAPAYPLPAFPSTEGVSSGGTPAVNPLHRMSFVGGMSQPSNRALGIQGANPMRRV